MKTTPPRPPPPPPPSRRSPRKSAKESKASPVKRSLSEGASQVKKDGEPLAKESSSTKKTAEKSKKKRKLSVDADEPEPSSAKKSQGKSRVAKEVEKEREPASRTPLKKSASTPTSKATYRAFMNRDGPTQLGSKQLPEAGENCLEGFSFVVTGVLESFEREEILDYIKKYGGKISGQVGKRTSYCVMGRDAGPKKIENVEKFRIKTLDEDEFLAFVSSLPSKRSKYSKMGPSPKKPKMEKIEEESPSFGGDVVLSGDHGSALLVDKYKPKSTKEIIGQQGDKSNVKKLMKWIKNWNDVNVRKTGRRFREDGSMFKAALLSGPPGVGKTTSASLVCKEAGYSFIEFNASVTRNKKTLEGALLDALGTHDIGNLIKGDSSGVKQAVIMDEVDGMSGNEDRGGIGELIALIKSSLVPIICICNDRQHPKIRSLANHCYDLRFQRPRVEQIKGAMMKVAFREKIDIKAPAIEQIATAANGDIRQTLHHLAMWSASGKTITFEDAKDEARKSKKQLIVTPFEAVRLVFSPQTQRQSVSEQTELFFQDYSLMPLFAWENYPLARPQRATNNPKEALTLLSRAADSFCYGDIIESSIRSRGNWDLLPVQAIFSSVVPGFFAHGPINQMISFPQWLGRNSKQRRLRRVLSELAVHIHREANVTSRSLTSDYLALLHQKIVHPLIEEGVGGVNDALSVMETYSLAREDIDSMSELVSLPGKPDLFSKVESKVKSAFTRAFNKASFVAPYSTGLPRKLRFQAVADDDDVGELSDNGTEDVEDNADPATDTMIKRKGKEAVRGRKAGRGSRGRGGRGKKSI
ncbi:replication factor C subunit 1-like isoform X2 [Oscarella lobularis]